MYIAKTILLLILALISVTFSVKENNHPIMKSKLLFIAYVYALHVFEKKNNILALPAFKLECSICSIQCSF